MTTNIGNSSDPFYRYKRPISIIENRSGKTIITNLEEIAKSLNTKSSAILYYIQLKKSTSVINKVEIKKTLSKQEIENTINTFIDEYILCKKCSLPECKLTKINEKLCFNCSACGHITQIATDDKFIKKFL